MKTYTDVQLKTITMDRNNSNKSAVVKAVFLDWLINSQAKNSNIDNIISSIDNASEQLLNRKISLASLWEITNPSIFAAVYKKAQNDKLRVMDKKAYSSFIKDGQIYLKFLKSKPDFQSYTVKHNDSAHGEKPPASMTIREAIIKVLSDEGASVTADKVYSKIIEYSLYTFGAQNPINVVRNVLDREPSVYSEAVYRGTPISEPMRDIRGQWRNRRKFQQTTV